MKTGPPLIFGTILFALAPARTFAADGQPDRIRTGPFYSVSPKSGGIPEFPDVQILVEPPLKTAPGMIAPDSFRIATENGQSFRATRVQTMASSGHSTAVAVVLDLSGSMKGAPLSVVRRGLLRFANDAGTHDRIAIATVADETSWEVNWGDPTERIRETIGSLAARGRLTRLWDGIEEAAERFPGSPSARRIVVISDGHDEGSLHTLDEAIASCRKRRIPVDSIGITRLNPAYLANLQRLSGETEGQFRVAQNEADIEKLVGGGIEYLRSLPVVTFRLEGMPADGKTHNLEVFWKRGGNESGSKLPADFPLSDAGFVAKTWLWAAGVAAILIPALYGLLRRRQNEPAFAVAAAAPPLSPPIPPAHTAGPETAVPQHLRGVTALAKAAPASEHAEAPATGAAAPRSVRRPTHFSFSFPPPSGDRPAAWLYGQQGFGSGEWFAVDAPEYWIGANENNHLQIVGDPTVSGNHACIVFETDVLGLFDHGSTNGTRVNDAVVKDRRHLLQPGDRIHVGHSIFVLHAQRGPHGTDSL